MNELAVRQQAQAAKGKEDRAGSQGAGASLDRLKVTVKAKQGEGGRLFGSVNNKDIADGPCRSA
jgi:large subunit ribosomal protein L9